MSIVSSSLLGGLKIKMLPSVILLLIISSSSILVSSSPLFFNTGNSNLDLALGGATLGGLGGLFLGDHLHVKKESTLSIFQEVSLEAGGEGAGGGEGFSLDKALCPSSAIVRSFLSWGVCPSFDGYTKN